MKNEIMGHLYDPGGLEKLYRSNRLAFGRAFAQLYPEVKGAPAADFWHHRLNYEQEDHHRGNSRELILVVLGALVAGVVAKLPQLLSLSEDFFYPRNIGFVLFPILSMYFAWKNKVSVPKIALVAATMLATLIFINALPNDEGSDTLILSCLHLLFFLWFLFAYLFVGSAERADEDRLRFLKYNGDVVVMTTLIVIAGGIMSGVTIGLFSLIGFRIERFYMEWVGVFGLAAAPIVASYLIQTNPHLVGKVSPVIARIFSPLVLVMLVVYVVAMILSGKNPYNDREYLLVFNALLIGVLAILFFSVAESSKTGRSKLEMMVLFLLSGVTVIVNGIALSAIVFRMAEMGITPNRLAVLGANILILINLLMVTAQFYRVVADGEEVVGVGRVIARFLPIYFFWTGIVTFIFPLLFRFE